MTPRSDGSLQAPVTMKRWLLVDRGRLAPIADWLVVAIAVSLPWSTTATSILIVLWVMALVPTLDAAAVKREIMTPAGGLPLLLLVLAALGMLWADVAWDERITGLLAFHKLLLIPLLLAQFRRSNSGHRIIAGFFLALLLLLAVSFVLAFLTSLPWRGQGSIGVPVKDYVSQSGLFAICVFGLLGQAIELWRGRHRALALAAVILAALFLANIVYVATGRTALVIMAVLLVALFWWYLGRKGLLAAALAAVVIGGLAWISSDYLRGRVMELGKEVEAYRSSGQVTSAGLRLEYWNKAITFIGEAPLLGHGTGTVRKLFQQTAIGAEEMAWDVTVNPHNQTLAVAIQLGLVGVAVLIAMWVAHLALFREHTLISWFGFIVVVQNIVSSQFNSHLFDFTQGWLYVFGVGVIGGIALQRSQARPNVRAGAPP
jgi:O-antigen ligase